jgi:hypothetical protein
MPGPLRSALRALKGRNRAVEDLVALFSALAFGMHFRLYYSYGM